MKSTKTVLVFGTFDVLHFGHLEFLRWCAEYGFVTIGLGTDEHQRSYKRDPIQTYEERQRALRALGSDFRIREIVAREKHDTRPVFNWMATPPDYLPFGSDWTEEGYLEVNGLTREYVESRGMTLIQYPRNHDMSTSEIIRRITNRGAA